LESEVPGMMLKYQGELLRYQYSCDKPEEGSKEQRCVGGVLHHMTPQHISWANKGSLGKHLGIRREKSIQIILASICTNQELIELNDKLRMGLKLEQWNSKYMDMLKEVLLGYMAKPGHQVEGLELTLSLVDN
jgi:hypothetical protein